MKHWFWTLVPQKTVWLGIHGLDNKLNHDWNVLLLHQKHLRIMIKSGIISYLQSPFANRSHILSTIVSFAMYSQGNSGNGIRKIKFRGFTRFLIRPLLDVWILWTRHRHTEMDSLELEFNGLLYQDLQDILMYMYT
jgi:hypothetical protein